MAVSPSLALTLAGGRLLGYAEYGDPNGTPVVSFHGWPGSQAQTARYDDAAKAEGVRLIAPERPGIGLSDPRPGASLHTHIDDVALLLDALEIDSLGVLGVSGGGPYALAAAALLPDRVSRVALVSALAPGSMGETRLIRATGWLGMHARSLFRPGFGAAALFARFDPPHAVGLAFDTLPPCDKQIVADPFIRELSIADAQQAFLQGGRGLRDDAVSLLSEPEIDLSAIIAPVNLWHGDADTIVPIATGRRNEAQLRHVTATWLPGEGHYLAIPRAPEILRVFR